MTPTISAYCKNPQVKIIKIYPNAWKESLSSILRSEESFVTWAKTQEIYEDRSKAATQELKQRNL